MMSLNILLNKEKSSDRPKEGKGRLWLSIDISSVKEPPLILKHCFRIALDAPMVLNDNITVYNDIMTLGYN